MQYKYIPKHVADESNAAICYLVIPDADGRRFTVTLKVVSVAIEEVADSLYTEFFIAFARVGGVLTANEGITRTEIKNTDSNLTLHLATLVKEVLEHLALYIPESRPLRPKIVPKYDIKLLVEQLAPGFVVLP